jgi:hypothetical protein
MDITKIDGSVAYVALMPDDCLILATACAWAADNWGDDGRATNPNANPATEYTFRTLAVAFQGMAFAAHASGDFDKQQQARFNRNDIARDWKVTPGILWGER